jgi:hypothetical protein
VFFFFRQVLNDTAAKATADPTPELTAKTESTLGLWDDLQVSLLGSGGGGGYVVVLSGVGGEGF